MHFSSLPAQCSRNSLPMSLSKIHFPRLSWLCPTSALGSVTIAPPPSGELIIQARLSYWPRPRVSEHVSPWINNTSFFALASRNFNYIDVKSGAIITEPSAKLGIHPYITSQAATLQHQPLAPFKPILFAATPRTRERNINQISLFYRIFLKIFHIWWKVFWHLLMKTVLKKC